MSAPDLTSDDVDAILDSCERNNAKRNITGLLLYNGRNFMQLLEGSEVDLLWVMRRVGADPRHSGVSVLEDLAIDEPACPDWSMQRLRLADDLSTRRAALDAKLPHNLHPQLRRVLLNFAALN